MGLRLPSELPCPCVGGGWAPGACLGLVAVRGSRNMAAQAGWGPRQAAGVGRGAWRGVGAG